MSMVVAHNIPAINANKNLYTSNRSLNGSLSKLSSGFRINTGADGPADLVISEQLRSQTNGLERAIRNTTEATNVLSVAEGALNEMNSILKKMKALAIHAANNGITSPEQVAADQAEMDSGIQTLERIATTTKYSDQFLLNGSKEITYSVSTDVKGTQNNQLTDTTLSKFNQIFKRDGYQVSIGFTGARAVHNDTALGTATMTNQASKAYLEIDAYNNTVSQVTAQGNLTKSQSFILTGSKGSRQFNFDQGAHISKIVNDIHNVAGSTGIDAALTFNRNQQINVSTTAAGATGVGEVSTSTIGSVTVYDNYSVRDDGTMNTIVTDTGALGGIMFGRNTDGQGNIFLKVTNATTGAYELYKDSSLSAESLIATGIGDGTDAVARNNSGFTGTFNLHADLIYGDVARISVGNISLTDGTVAGTQDNVTTKGAGGCLFNFNNSTASGVSLGKNTDTSGKIYLKTTYGEDGQTAMIRAYNNALMRDEDLVAETKDQVDLTSGGSIVLDSIWNKEKSANTGLGLTLNLAGLTNAQLANKEYSTETSEIQFNNLGARIFTSDYGSDQELKVQMLEGGIFVDYEDQGNYDTAKLIEAGTTFSKSGQDATVTVNGQSMTTTGLKLNLATPDIQANITFNSGKSGSTTLAQVGYDESSIFTKNTSLTFTNGLNAATGNLDNVGGSNGNNANFSGLLNNAGHVTEENIDNFQGGMQLQLGEGSGDQERTVIGLQSMSTANLGRMDVTQRFNKSSAVVETRSISIQHVMGGQVADLSTDATLAMKVIEKAISDVSTVRAQIGAVQSNMLQTNENNLRVAVENLTKTESAIRDTDMASEMTEFTKNQILSNAGINMLSQANAQAQNVLSLLQ